MDDAPVGLDQEPDALALVGGLPDELAHRGREDVAPAHPEEATVQAMRRLIAGESSAPALAAGPDQMSRKKAMKK